MPKFNVGDRVRVVPGTPDPYAAACLGRYGSIQHLHDEGLLVSDDPHISPSRMYDVLLDPDLVLQRETVTLPEHTLEASPR